MLEDDSIEQLLETIRLNLPGEYKDSEVVISGNYKGILCDGEVLARYFNEEIYMHQAMNGLGAAVICGLRNCGYEIIKNPSDEKPYFKSGVGLSVFFRA